MPIGSVAIARLCHEVNRAYCQSLGDDSQVPWEEAPEWQKRSAINGVEFHLANPTADPRASHANWLREKRAAGWKFGPVKDVEKKEHPCCLDYDLLPQAEKTKDFLFRAIVHAMKDVL